MRLCLLSPLLMQPTRIKQLVLRAAGCGTSTQQTKITNHNKEIKIISDKNEAEIDDKDATDLFAVIVPEYFEEEDPPADIMMNNLKRKSKKTFSSDNHLGMSATAVEF